MADGSIGSGLSPLGTQVTVGDSGNAVTQAAPSSFLGDVGAGLSSTLGGASLGTALGTAIPYAAVAGIGEAQAAAGQKEDAANANEMKSLAQPALGQSASLLGQYNSGTLNKTDQTVVDTGVAQGQDTIASAGGLSAIAQTAFANYNSGKLNAGDQAALDAQTAAAKQQIAQQLASAGITDSTILAAHNNQIDQQALISKQNTLNSYFTTGNQAYDSWLNATNEGKAQITAAQTFASTTLNGYLQSSMAEAGIGMTEMNTAIQTQMQTDQEYAAQVSSLMGTLASAYAKQMAGNASKGGSTGLPRAAGSAAAGALKGAGGGVSTPSSASLSDTTASGTQDVLDSTSSYLNNEADINSSYLGSLTDMSNEIQGEVSVPDLNFADDSGDGG